MHHLSKGDDETFDIHLVEPEGQFRVNFKLISNAARQLNFYQIWEFIVYISRQESVTLISLLVHGLQGLAFCTTNFTCKPQNGTGGRIR